MLLQACNFLEKLFSRCESSDNMSFTEFSLFINTHRNLGDTYASQGCLERAEHHYAACSGLMLQVPHCDVELRNKELLGHIEQRIPSSEASEEQALSLMTCGVEEFKKCDDKNYDRSRDFLMKALTCSRICGATDVELNTLANLGNVEAAANRHILSASYCDQYCTLSHFAKGGYDPALPSVTVFQSRQLMNAGLYRKAMKSIDMSLLLLSRVSDDIDQLSKRDTIEKLEIMKQEACNHLSIFNKY